MLSENQVSSIVAKIANVHAHDSDIAMCLSELDIEDLKKIIEHAFTFYSPTWVFPFMFQSVLFWENMSLRDWREVLTCLDNHELALTFGVIPFLSIFLQIDAVYEYCRAERAGNAQMKQSVREFFGRSPGMLKVTRMHEPWFKQYSQAFSILESIHNRLIQEGARKHDPS